MRSDFDATINSAMATYMPWVDWRWGKAQLFTESNLDPQAYNKKSGAQGIAQFMPDTWDEERQALGFDGGLSPFEPIAAIKAYAHYMGRLWRMWKDPRRSPEDRLRWAQASYNAGPGTVLEAQRNTGMAYQWDVIRPLLPTETQGYIDSIAATFAELSAPT
jgi:soluble lytic murein transglycosylase-like protein